MRGIFSDGGKKLQHRAVTITVAEGIKAILPANSKRLRVQMYNSALAGSVVYVGDNVDVNGAALAAANGWPLWEDHDYNVGDVHQKILANVLELFTQDTVYGLAVGGTGIVKMIEELTD